MNRIRLEEMVAIGKYASIKLFDNLNYEEVEPYLSQNTNFYYKVVKATIQNQGKPQDEYQRIFSKIIYKFLGANPSQADKEKLINTMAYGHLVEIMSLLKMKTNVSKDYNAMNERLAHEIAKTGFTYESLQANLRNLKNQLILYYVEFHNGVTEEILDFAVRKGFNIDVKERDSKLYNIYSNQLIFNNAKILSVYEIVKTVNNSIGIANIVELFALTESWRNEVLIDYYQYGISGKEKLIEITNEEKRMYYLNKIEAEIVELRDSFQQYNTENSELANKILQAGNEYITNDMRVSKLYDVTEHINSTVEKIQTLEYRYNLLRFSGLVNPLEIRGIVQE